MASAKDGFWSHFTSGAAKALGGLVATGLALWIWEPLRSWVWRMLSTLWGHLFQSYSLPMWMWYLFAIWSIVMTTLWAVRLMRDKTANDTRPTSDSFFGALWRWRYDTSGRPADPMPYCTDCDMQMVYSQTGGGYYSEQPLRTTCYCERCNSQTMAFDGGVVDAEGRVLREIDRRLRSDR